MNKRITAAVLVAACGATLLTGCKSGSTGVKPSATANPLKLTVSTDPCAAVFKASSLKNWTHKELPKASTYRKCQFTNKAHGNNQRVIVWLGGDPDQKSGNKTIYQADLAATASNDPFTYSAPGLSKPAQGFVALDGKQYTGAEATAKGYTLTVKPAANTTLIVREDFYTSILQAFANTMGSTTVTAIPAE